MNDHTSVFRNVHFLAGPIHAGFPSPAEDWREKRLDVNDLVVPHPVSTYFMRVEGNSMHGCNGYLAHPFEKEAPWAFTARLFFVVRWVSAIDPGGEWFSYTRENTALWAADYQERHAQTA